MTQTLRSAFQRTFRRENRRSSVRRGRLERIQGFHSEILGNERDLTIYLPPGYDEHPEKRYPVLYMQDGQNLFDPERAFVPGNHWQLAESADAAIGGAEADAVIIVGIDHANAGRMDEYTPTRCDVKKGGGRANDYGRMLVEELKPMIDERFRTRADREHTAIGGSSLGGLVSLHLALTRPDVFGRAAVMSPSVWWDERTILGCVDQFGGEKPLIWVDIGGREGKEALNDARALRDRLLAKGWSAANFRFHEDRRADHSERAWAGRAKTVLEFLFPPE
ncbi:MAG: alpha/beta hydrolase [Acidobacteria bacterium]|nr:alpha/beta hydrolase [Acidobacteriota bacterium]